MTLNIFDKVNKISNEPGVLSNTFYGALSLFSSYLANNENQSLNLNSNSEISKLPGGLPYGYEADIWALGLAFASLSNYEKNEKRLSDESYFLQKLDYWDIVDDTINDMSFDDFLSVSLDG